MRYPRIKDYPKTIKVNRSKYTIEFVDSIENEVGVWGMHEDGKYPSGKRTRKRIYIKRGLSKKNTFETFLHEILHAIESEYRMRIKHKLVYRLETPLANLIIKNFNFTFKR